MPRTVPAPEMPRQRSGLQGGSRDDVTQRADYLRYLQGYSGGDVHKVDISQRVMVNVLDELETGLPNAHVSLMHHGRRVQHATSYANGRAQLFPRAAGLRGGEEVEIVVEAQGRTHRRSVTLGGADQQVSLVMPVAAQRKAPVVDLMFVIDTTGSMGDEISRIQLTLLDVAARIQRLEPGATIRYGLTLYRDRGDAYVTQVRDFTTNVQAFLADLQQAEADGGGDTPEALNEGLHAALTGARWTAEDTPNALRVVLLVADAPPHLDYEQDYDYAKEMRGAAERGIKIFPIAASGLDDQGEYIFRQMAHHTQGRFVFITYGGGTGHHVGQFANNNLDDLVVGLVADEMADLMGRPRGAVRALAMAR
ncbi:MAG: vWA domain-containing protein [Myxococcota bacterium]